MAGKLYWRIKKDGKWTWKPAEVYVLKNNNDDDIDTVCVWPLEEEQ